VSAFPRSVLRLADRYLLPEILLPLILPDFSFSPLRRIAGQGPVVGHSRALGFFLRFEHFVRGQQGQERVVRGLKLAIAHLVRLRMLI